MTKVHTHTWVNAKTNSTPVISSGRRPVEKDWHWQLWKIINIWMERRYLWPKKNQQQKKRPLPLVVLQSSWRLERTPPQRHRRLGWTGKHRELPSYKYVYLITKVLNQNVEGCRILQISYLTCLPWMFSFMLAHVDPFEGNLWESYKIWQRDKETAMFLPY